MNFFENITLRSQRRRSDTEILTFDDDSSNDSTIEGATNCSVPNIIDEENEIIEDLKRQIKELNSQLQSAHNEVNNLSIENTELKKTIESMNSKHKMMEKATKRLASEIRTPSKKSTLSTPIRGAILKQRRDISELGTPEMFTPTQATPQKNVDKIRNSQKMKKASNSTRQGHSNKLCIISSNRNNKILAIAENTFPSHQICHYLLPNTGIKTLLCSIHTKVADYTMKDNCIVFIGENDFRQTNNYFDLISYIRESLSAIKHTNIILCLPTYKYNYYSTMYNFRVEMFGSLLYQDLQNHKYATLCDSNLNLSWDYTMFDKRRGRINNYGIRTIFNDLKSYVYANMNETVSMKDLLPCGTPNSYCSCINADTPDQQFFRI